ncbi:unnamed protein product [Rhizophagus irregularis]|nr:unnamed protein product [Rhizophagus irregularis]
MDSILLCKEAWNAVTHETIYNCWLKTGILPSCFTSPNNNKEQDSENEEQDSEAEEQEFQELLDEYYNLQDHEKEMSAEEFITIDKDINIGKEELTDEDIINIINSNESEEEQQEEITQPKVTILEAMNSLDQVIAFINNPPDNFSIEVKHLAALKDMKSKIGYFYKKHKKQVSLDNWISNK